MDELWQKAKHHLDEGNFTSLQNHLGGPAGFDRQIVEWFDAGKFAAEAVMLAEALSCSFMLGRTATARYLLDKGVDPYAGMKTGLAGPHYAVSGGHLDTVKMLIDRKVTLEVENWHGGTLLGQALWSAINEHKYTHANIVEMLIEAGSHVWPETLEWWNRQPVPSAATKQKVSELLELHADLQIRLNDARELVAKAREGTDEVALADALKQFGSIKRRVPFLRDDANRTYVEAAGLYRDLGRPLDEAWVKRHIGINHEYAGRLEDAEKYYDEALALYRGHSVEDDLNYANAVRYPAVIKKRLAKNTEAGALWKEAFERYEKIGVTEGIAEGAATLAILALESGDTAQARKWYEKANAAAQRSEDAATHNFVGEVKQRLNERRNEY